MNEKEYLQLIGKNISKIRKKKSFTLVQLGDACNIEKSNLIPIEKGRINVTATTLLRIAIALDVDVQDFFKF
jgi:transcriptional regulator with XRE-family HTH domain